MKATALQRGKAINKALLASLMSPETGPSIGS